MDQMLDIPENRQTPKVGRLCLLLAMIFLLFLGVMYRQAGELATAGQAQRMQLLSG